MVFSKIQSKEGAILNSRFYSLLLAMYLFNFKTVHFIIKN